MGRIFTCMRGTIRLPESTRGAQRTVEGGSGGQTFGGCLRCDACAGYVYMISVIGFMQAPESYGDLVVALIEVANWTCGILFGLTGIGFFVCLGVVLTFVFILAAVVVYSLADIFRDPYKPCRAVGLCP